MCTHIMYVRATQWHKHDIYSIYTTTQNDTLQCNTANLFLLLLCWELVIASTEARSTSEASVITVCMCVCVCIIVVYIVKCGVCFYVCCQIMLSPFQPHKWLCK